MDSTIILHVVCQRALPCGPSVHRCNSNAKNHGLQAVEVCTGCYASPGRTWCVNCIHTLSLIFMPSFPGQADNGPIRLWRSGTTSLSYTSGRVQLMYISRWGNICDEFGSFNLTEATVICHQLGFTGASAYNRASDDQ